MKLLEHNGQGASIHLDQRELLMVMALIQEGRDSFECEGQTGLQLDQLFSSANMLVEQARRSELKKNGMLQKVGKVAPADDELAPPARKFNGQV